MALSYLFTLLSFCLHFRRPLLVLFFFVFTGRNVPAVVTVFERGLEPDIVDGEALSPDDSEHSLLMEDPLEADLECVPIGPGTAHPSDPSAAPHQSCGESAVWTVRLHCSLDARWLE